MHWRSTATPGNAPTNEILLQHDLHELVMDTLGPESARAITCAARSWTRS
jgi:hypothetical protein